MNDDEEIDYLWGIALGKKAGWQYSDFPVVKDKLPKFAEAWNKSKKKTQYKTGKPISVEMVEQYWIAEARQRRMDREKKIKVSQPVGATVWLNDERWNNGVEAERTETKADKRKCNCGQEVHGPQYSECIDCIGKDENGRLKGWAVEQMRDFHKRYPGLKHRNREQSIAFLKQRMKGMGRYKKPVIVRIINKLNNPHKYNHVYK